MYIFKEFNRAHHNQIRTSITLYLVALFVLWSATCFFLGNLNAALKVTIAGLAVTHVVRISTGLRDIRLTTVQYFFVPCAALVITLLVIFAFSQTTASEQAPSWNSFNKILLSLSLATYLSIYVDFAIASLFPRTNRTRP